MNQMVAHLSTKYSWYRDANMELMNNECYQLI